MSNTAEHSLDHILVQLGDFGKYQISVFSLVCFAVILHSAIHVAFVFTAKDLDYRCKIPGCDGNVSIYHDDWVVNAVPFTNGKPAKCDSFLKTTNETSDECPITYFDHQELVRCQEFIYENDERTILNDFNLQCDENLWKLTLVGTINNIGQFFGLFISGVISDKYGRRKVLVYGMVFSAICGLLRTLAPTYEWFLVFEFFDAIFSAGTYLCGFIIGVELVGPKKRVLTGTIISSCYAVGEVFVAASAWLVQSWKPLSYILYTPAFLLLSYLWLVPESVRWNLSKGRLAEAKKTIKKCAEVNGKTLNENILEKLGCIDPNVDEKNKHTLREIFKSTPLVLRFINCCFCWITCAFLFYGLTLNSVALAGNSYMDFILTSLVEIPAYFLCIYIVNYLGRRLSLSGCFLLTGLSCLAFIFIPSDSQTGSLIVYLVGKFGATAAFTVTYVVTSEIFPTPLRHSMMGACSTIGRIGSMISPQTPLLAQIWLPLPLIMFASMAIVAGLLTLFFPETKGEKLPDTIEEAVNIGIRKNVDDKC